MPNNKNRATTGNHTTPTSPSQAVEKPRPVPFSSMLKIFNTRLRSLCSRCRWPTRLRLRRRPKPKVLVKTVGKPTPAAQSDPKFSPGSAAIHPNAQLGGSDSSESERTIRIATFNASLFSMAPAVPNTEGSASIDSGNGDFAVVRRSPEINLRAKSANDRPRGILKQSPLHPNSNDNSENLSRQQKFARSKLRVSINLPDNEISLERSRKLSFAEDENEGSSSNSMSRILRGKAPLRPSSSFSSNDGNGADCESYRSRTTLVEVLRELDADILALQDVKAEEEKGMKPLSDLAAALGMNYVFAESWAPEYGNAVLSKWPIKRWKALKIFDDTDFRNVLKTTIDVPQIGEVNFHCTHLDHFDENWRMKQINAIIQYSDEPHILAGGLNSLDESDYSQERWADIVKYHEDMGKPTPKVELMKFLKERQYTDAKDFPAECEPVVMIAKGQSVQGTCKYGTRVDYILSSPNSPYKFVPGSYSVLSSKGTSDHHIVKVDIKKLDDCDQENGSRRQQQQPKQKVVKINSASPNGIFRMSAGDR
ncbi:uncharacterized protein LOC131155449 [Malania oleifera]|uniref:uncharacterized protein LOC131155449 n=1 Tax=Malania oleifera TaxID=397392 RepID=UPI0025AEBDD7|nr:uncharacterized protein LOC131155449 [Malania oleifera]